MVRPKDRLDVPLSLQHLETDESDPPVTPINRSFTSTSTDSFVTAILSPSSTDVFAARARARSRSDAPVCSTAAMKTAAASAVHHSPSLDSIGTPRPCDTISEFDTPPSGEIQQTVGVRSSVLPSQYESPSLARRSRILSSTGVAVGSLFPPLAMQDLGMAAKVSQVMERSSDRSHAVRPLFASRPRASTLSVPSPSQYVRSSKFHLLNGTSVAFANVQPPRHRAFSSFDERCTGTADESRAGLPLPLTPCRPLAPWTTSLMHTSSSDNHTAQLSAKSSLASLGSRYDSSFGSSMEANELSLTMSNSLSETVDTSQASLALGSTHWKPQGAGEEREVTCEESQQHFLQVAEQLTGASSALSIASRGSTVGVRRKSHTISEVGVPRRLGVFWQVSESLGQQDVFGPTVLALPALAHDAPHPPSHGVCRPLSSSKSSGQLGAGRACTKPRRLTVGGHSSSIPTGPRGSSRAALHRQNKPPSHSRATSATVSQEQSLTAFQELIQGLVKERPVQSSAIEEGEPAEPQSIGAVLEYQRCSPSGHGPDHVGGQECQLCGALARRLTILEPCGHQACAVCCSSGLNQVTATPPRLHTCAACHTPVLGITLCKGVASQGTAAAAASAKSGPLVQTPSGPRRRPQTPSPDEQKLLFRHVHPTSPTKAFTPEDATRTDKAVGAGHRRASTSKGRQEGVMACSKVIDLANESGETTSSDLLTEDQSFYQSQRTMQLASSSSRVGWQADSMEAGGGMPMREEPRSQTAQGTSVVRIDNIPWTVTYNDVVQWLPQPYDAILPDSDSSSASVHVPVDVFSGKTSNCCFVECKGKEEAMRLVRHRNNSRLLGRPVSLILTTLDDLLDEIFPSRIDSPSLEDHECVFFTPIHLKQLMELLRRGGAQLKGPLKIVDVTTSMLRLVPANMSSVLSEMLFHRAKEIVCICIAASQDISALRQSLDRLLLACSSCACFSVGQRIELLDSARGTLTAVTQVKQLPPASSSSANLAYHSHPTALTGHSPLKDLGNNRAARMETAQSGQTLPLHDRQQLLFANEAAAFFSHQTVTLGPSPFPIDSPSWQPYSSTAATEAAWSGLLPSSVTASGCPSPPFPRPLGLHRSADYREAALQTLVSYGIRPAANSEGFDKMVNQLAQAFAKQQIKPNQADATH